MLMPFWQQDEEACAGLRACADYLCRQHGSRGPEDGGESRWHRRFYCCLRVLH